MKRIYLSGKMTGHCEAYYKGKFLDAHFRLMRTDVKIINPVMLAPCRWPLIYRLIGYRWTLWYDLLWLRSCTHIHMVGHDWMTSRGARLERLKARRWGIVEI